VVSLIEENCREVRNDLVGLNIWWDLSILRDTLKGGGQKTKQKCINKGEVSCRFNEKTQKHIGTYQDIVSLKVG
jgi:hypothetical protein